MGWCCWFDSLTYWRGTLVEHCVGKLAWIWDRTFWSLWAVFNNSADYCCSNIISLCERLIIRFVKFSVCLNHLDRHSVRIWVSFFFNFLYWYIPVDIWQPIGIWIITLTKICHYLFRFANIKLVLDLRCGTHVFLIWLLKDIFLDVMSIYNLILIIWFKVWNLLLIDIVFTAFHYGFWWSIFFLIRISSFWERSKVMWL